MRTSLFASLLVLALAVSGCADDFAADVPSATADASTSLAAPAAHSDARVGAPDAPGFGDGAECSFSLVGPRSLGALETGTYEVVPTSQSSPVCGDATLYSWSTTGGTVVSSSGLTARVRAPASSSSGGIQISAIGSDGFGQFFRARTMVSVPRPPAGPQQISLALGNHPNGVSINWGAYGACGLSNHDYVEIRRVFSGATPPGLSTSRTFYGGNCSTVDTELELQTSFFSSYAVTYSVRVVGMSGETLAEGSRAALVRPRF